jgi:capsular polysaccharide biosynthesis protein
MNRTTVRNLYRRALRWPILAYGVLPAVEKVGLVFSKTRSRGKMAPVVEKLAQESARLGLEVRSDLPPRLEFYPASGADAAQVGEHVWRGKGLILRFYDAAANASIARGKEYFGMLYGCQRLELPATFTAWVPNARIDAKTGMTLTESGEILKEANFNRIRDEDRCRLAEVSQIQHERHEGEFVCLVHPWSTNYAHWLLDLLPRVVLAQKHGFEGSFLIPKTAHGFLAASLRCLGVSEDRIVRTDAPHLQVERLLAASPAEIGLKSRPEYVREIGDRMRAAVGNAKEPPTRRLYISRKAAERSIVNEGELRPILDKRGFEILQPENLSFEEQVAAFAEASVLIGPHGAGMYNALFMRPPGLVVEVLNEARWEISVVRLARMLGLEHWHIHAENRDFATWDTYAEPKAFERSLDQALEFLEWRGLPK